MAFGGLRQRGEKISKWAGRKEEQRNVITLPPSTLGDLGRDASLARVADAGARNINHQICQKRTRKRYAQVDIGVLQGDGHPHCIMQILEAISHLSNTISSERRRVLESSCR